MRPTFFASAAEFRAWLARHNTDTSELLVGFHKKKTGRPSLTWPESVDEALCVGWIDGVRRSNGDDTYTIRFTPRKKGSHWSNINVARVAELRRAGRMTPAGLAAFAMRDTKKTGLASYERKQPAELPEAQAKRLQASREASAFLAAQPPWYRRTAIHWVVSAKQEATRERRLLTLIADSAAGRRIGPTRYAGKQAAPAKPRPKAAPAKPRRKAAPAKPRRKATQVNESSPGPRKR